MKCPPWKQWIGTTKKKIKIFFWLRKLSILYIQENNHFSHQERVRSCQDLLWNLECGAKRRDGQDGWMRICKKAHPPQLWSWIPWSETSSRAGQEVAPMLHAPWERWRGPRRDSLCPSWGSVWLGGPGLKLGLSAAMRPDPISGSRTVGLVPILTQKIGLGYLLGSISSPMQCRWTFLTKCIR